MLFLSSIRCFYGCEFSFYACACTRIRVRASVSFRNLFSIKTFGRCRMEIRRRYYCTAFFRLNVFPCDNVCHIVLFRKFRLFYLLYSAVSLPPSLLPHSQVLDVLFEYSSAIALFLALHVTMD